MNLGFQEILVIAVVALIVVGPDRLPDLARRAAKLLSQVRSETSKSISELKAAADVDDLDRELKAMREEIREAGRELTGASRPSVPVPADAPPPTDSEAT